MTRIVQFGEQVDGYDIPVLNEREIRGAAGLLFVMMFTTILIAVIASDFTPLKYAIIIFLADILTRVLVNPRYAPSMILGRLMVRNQAPEYVGAAQKRFAWIIGIVLGVVMFALQVVANTFGPITGLICLLCLVFLFFETAFGICIGCKVYNLVYRERAQHCPGEVCDVSDRQPIQRTPRGHLLIVAGLIALMVLVGRVYHEDLSVPPRPMFPGLAPEAVHE